ncbi:MAG: hypothetical protein RLZZ618_1281 [Pseudomonadota bacterium]|jgi:3-methyladenine DNA glycosylase AlkC
MDDPSPALKDGFADATVNAIAQRLADASPEFQRARFKKVVLDGFDELSLMARVRRVAEGMVAALPADFAQALAIVERALGEPPHIDDVSEGMGAFQWAPFLEFVAIAGIAHPELALPALARLTRHFTGEFAIRPFLEQHLDTTRDHVRSWVTHTDPRVRRLASEGTRPLLPWGKHVTLLKREPHDGLALIEALAHDSSDNVRRSAANHLNDVSRLFPDLALQHANRWATQSELGQATARHAMRTLIKKGHPAALGLLGYDVAAEVTLSGLTLSAKRLAIGDTLQVQATLTAAAKGKKAVRCCVDYAVRYASARGTERLKVFKGSSLSLMPGEPVVFAFQRDFIPRTTRVLYPGEHAVQVLVNGVMLGEQGFTLGVS